MMGKERPPLRVDSILPTVETEDDAAQTSQPYSQPANYEAYSTSPGHDTSYMSVPGGSSPRPFVANAAHPPLSPSSPNKISFSPTASRTRQRTSSGASLNAQPSFRRHNRQRSSTIFVAPRPAPPVTPTGETPVPNVLIKGVTTLAGAQVLAKLLAFLSNQVLIRFLSARELGAASQLELLVSTALVLSRDAIRLASQRQTIVSVARASGYTTDARAVLGTLVGTYQETSNLGWLSVSSGTVIVTMISSILYLKHAWQTSVIVVASSAASIELLAEPGFLVSQLKIQLAERARAESLANFVRVIVVGSSSVLLHVSPFLGFALGHLGYSSTSSLAIQHVTRRDALQDGFSMSPSKVWDSSVQKRSVYVSDAAWNASLELGVQQIIKFILTEGDRLAVSVMTTSEEQGEYASAANYGSLLARMVFSPVEEALRSYFSRESNDIAAKLKDKNSSLQEKRSDPSSDDSTEDVEKLEKSKSSRIVLSSTLRTYSYLGIFSAGFGPLASSFLLNILVRSSKFGAAAQVLAAYAYYIPVMAWNGALESLVQSTASLRTLRTQGTLMAGLAVLFVILTYVFVSVCELGGAGIVWAQVCTMMLRIAWALHYSETYFGQQKQWFSECLPNKYIGLVSSVSIAIARFFMPHGARSFSSFILLACLASIPAITIAASERKLIMGLRSKLFTAKKDKLE